MQATVVKPCTPSLLCTWLQVICLFAFLKCSETWMTERCTEAHACNITSCFPLSKSNMMRHMFKLQYVALFMLICFFCCRGWI